MDIKYDILTTKFFIVKLFVSFALLDYFSGFPPPPPNPPLFQYKLGDFSRIGILDLYKRF